MSVGFGMSVKPVLEKVTEVNTNVSTINAKIFPAKTLSYAISSKRNTSGNYITTREVLSGSGFIKVWAALRGTSTNDYSYPTLRITVDGVVKYEGYGTVEGKVDEFGGGGGELGWIRYNDSYKVEAKISGPGTVITYVLEAAE